MARAIMLQGTGSDVGKSVLVAGLCRVAARRGLKVRPFKPQNMSNNAAVAAIPGGGEGEIGRAQWLQALACGAAPTVHINPVLLKPQSDIGSQIIVQGRYFGEALAKDFQSRRDELLAAVLDSWAKLKEGADLIVVEGAGSPAEVNLRERDIANMGFATRADVPVILVGDIDRGGVIASLVGTHAVISQEDRRMITGYLINKFRGDVSLFAGGITAIGEHTGWPCFGVVPWLEAVARLPSEDGVALERLVQGRAAKVKIAVPMLSRIANFDDFDPLSAEPEVDLIFVPPGQRLSADADLIILPGTKSTIADLIFFRQQGWEQDLLAHRAKGGRVLGICGGYQMLGRAVRDPDGVEGNCREIDGLGLLDIETEMTAGKVVRNVSGHSLVHDEPLKGYEIHLGRTAGPDCARAYIAISGQPDGAQSADGAVAGCYLHGLFETAGFRRKFLAGFGAETSGVDHRSLVEAALDSLATSLEQHLNIDAMLAAAR